MGSVEQLDVVQGLRLEVVEVGVWEEVVFEGKGR